MESVIKKVAHNAKGLGLRSFVLAVKNGKLLTFHYEEMSIHDAMEIAIANFHHVINLELDRHPEYSKEYREIYTDLAKGFDKLVKDTDARFISFQKKNKK